MTGTIMIYKKITLLLLMLKLDMYQPYVIIGRAIVAADGSTVKTGCSNKHLIKGFLCEELLFHLSHTKAGKQRYNIGLIQHFFSKIANKQINKQKSPN